MKEVAELDQELTIEERNLLSVAYKNIIVSYISLIETYASLRAPECYSACTCSRGKEEQRAKSLESRRAKASSASGDKMIQNGSDIMLSRETRAFFAGRSKGFMENRQLHRKQRRGELLRLSRHFHQSFILM